MKKESSILKVAIWVLILGVPLSIINSCVWDKAPLTSHGNDGVKDSICYEKEIQPIINSNCAMSGCHDATTHEEGIDLSSYFGVLDLVKPGKPEKSKLIEVITRSGEEAMPPPPNAPLNTEQIDLITQWINEGAGINIDCNTETVCDTSNITYSGTVVPIMQTYCLGCHSSVGTGGGVLLNSYNGVKEQVNSGRLWGAINWLSGYSPMPQNGSMLSSCDITKIGIWIDQGAPNN